MVRVIINDIFYKNNSAGQPTSLEIECSPDTTTQQLQNQISLTTGVSLRDFSLIIRIAKLGTEDTTYLMIPLVIIPQEMSIVVWLGAVPIYELKHMGNVNVSVLKNLIREKAEYDPRTQRLFYKEKEIDPLTTLTVHNYASDIVLELRVD